MFFEHSVDTPTPPARKKQSTAHQR